MFRPPGHRPRFVRATTLVLAVVLVASLTPQVATAADVDVPPRPSAPLAESGGDGVVRLTFAIEAQPGSSPIDRVRVQRRRLVAPVAAVAPIVGADAGRITTRIVHGDIIDIADAPWQVRVNDGCGGTLVQRTWVMTAAHCVDGQSASTMAVWSGLTDRRDMTSRNAVRVRSVWVHPRWDPDTFSNDVALLELDTRADGTPVRLQASSRRPRGGSSAFITGWGFLAYDEPPMPNQLHGANVTVLAGPGEMCGDYGEKDFDGAIMLCAGAEDGSVDTCQGDSGGPLVVDVDDRRYVAGITSWGVGCATPGFPGVYTRVSRFTAWIHRTLGWRDVTTIDCATRSCKARAVRDLESGAGYVFRIRVHDRAGWSKWSKPSSAADAG